MAPISPTPTRETSTSSNNANYHSFATNNNANNSLHYHPTTQETTANASSNISTSTSIDGQETQLIGASSLSNTINITLKTQLYTKRYLILLIFILYSASNSFQWIEYAIIGNIITKFYDTTNFWVNCTSVVYMVSYIIGIFPASYLLERKGLRYCVLVGAFGTSLGAWIKVLSVARDRFWISMIGQTIVAFSQLFILEIPPLLAAVWFSEREVSRATAYGVFGNQVGIALGFFVPSFLVPNFSSASEKVLNPSLDQLRDNEINRSNVSLVPNSFNLMLNSINSTQPTYGSNLSIQPIENNNLLLLDATDLATTNASTIGYEQVASGLRMLFYSVAIFTTLMLLIITFFFTNKPPHPPSTAQAQAQLVNESSNTSFSDSLKSLAKNRNFVLLFITYGLNTGVFYAISTVLNQMVTHVFGDTDEITSDAGYCGLIITLSGIVGSLVCGMILDWTHKYKETTLAIYILSLAGMLAFTSALHYHRVWPLFFVSGVLGFFMTGYLPIGFEFAAEVTYPHPEGTCAGMLNTAAQIFGIILTFGGSEVENYFGHLAANLIFVFVLVVGTILTSMIKADLRRQRASRKDHAIHVDGDVNNGNKLLNTL